jgi:stearoyl-CoA desaturase (delta-9 desaturase)
MERIALWRSLPFFLMHAACALVFWYGYSPFSVWTCVFLYFVRMFAITAGYHRYFAHASFKTSRWFQFLLAWIGASSVQKGPLWWAAHHRHHHAHSDTEEDIHSPVTRNFWWSHMGWFLCTKYDETPLHLIRPYSKYPELRWVNEYHAVPGIVLGITLAVVGNWLAIHAPQLGTSGPQLVIWGLISTVLLFHGTFTVNSLAHVYGSRRYQTKDDSRNNLLIALITLGEGWHNNHHYAPSSERQGFYWWEIDIAHYMLVMLSWLGVVWDLKQPPPRVYDIQTAA